MEQPRYRRQRLWEREHRRAQVEARLESARPPARADRAQAPARAEAVRRWEHAAATPTMGSARSLWRFARTANRSRPRRRIRQAPKRRLRVNGSPSLGRLPVDEPAREVDVDPFDSRGIEIGGSEHRFEGESTLFEQLRPFFDLRRALVVDDDDVALYMRHVPDLVELEQMPARRLETPRRVVSETKALLAVHGLITSAVGPRHASANVFAPAWRGDTDGFRLARLARCAGPGGVGRRSETDSLPVSSWTRCPAGYQPPP
jgi:hypothetical protein